MHVAAATERLQLASPLLFLCLSAHALLLLCVIPAFGLAFKLIFRLPPSCLFLSGTAYIIDHRCRCSHFLLGTSSTFSPAAKQICFSCSTTILFHFLISVSRDGSEEEEDQAPASLQGYLKPRNGQAQQQSHEAEAPAACLPQGP